MEVRRFDPVGVSAQTGVLYRPARSEALMRLRIADHSRREKRDQAALEGFVSMALFYLRHELF